MLIILLIPIAAALNLGTLVKNDFIVIKENETAVFEILLWSKDENYTIILQDRQIPENFNVLIEPKIVANQDKDNIYISVEDHIVKASKIKVFATPKEAKPGEYHILLSAMIYQPVEKINVIQEREILLKVKVLGEYNEINTSSLIDSRNQNFAKNVLLEKVENGKIIIVLIILTLIVVAIIIKS